MRGLALRTGVIGNQQGRLVWAEIPWDSANPADRVPGRDPYEQAVRVGEATLARRFIGVPIWFGRSTLAWWALLKPGVLVSAPTAPELAGLLQRLLDIPPSLSVSRHATT